MKKSNLYFLATAILSASMVHAETEISAKLVHESGFFTKAGSTIGDRPNQTTLGTGMSQTPYSKIMTPEGMYRGVQTGRANLDADPTHSSGDQFKSETMLKIYVDGNVNDDATYHLELNPANDSQATSEYDGNESYTQRDVLREAYIDTNVSDWSIRAGKQQVVWGTADGMKLLDAINPTDYAEMAQNQMEDSRIPVWMLNGEKILEDGSSVQLIVSQPRENVFAGLNRHIDTSTRFNSNMSKDDSTLNNGTDTGHTYMLMGPDSISGVYNGFLNITPDLGSVATRFGAAFKADTDTDSDGTLTGDADDLTSINTSTGAYTIDGLAIAPSNDGTYSTAIDTKINAFNATFAGNEGNLGGQSNQADGMNGFTVGGFKGMTMGQMSDALNPAGGNGKNQDGTLAYIAPGFKKAILDTWQGLIAPTAQGGYGSAAAVKEALNLGGATADYLTGEHMLALGFQPLYNTNLNNLTTADDSAFDYMKQTTFKTFDAYNNAGSKYNYIMPKDSDVDLAARIRKTTSDGTNYSFAASYNYDKNPIINLSWKGASGQTLSLRETKHNGTPGQGGVAVDATSCASLGAYCTTTLQLYDASNAAAISAITAAGIKTVNATKDNGFYGGQAQDSAFNAAYTSAIANGSSAQEAQGAGYMAAQNHRAYLQFDQEVKRVLQLGGAFDTVVETEEFGPVVIRGEALYTKDGYAPVMNKDRLAIGDLVGALQMKKADRFKFVLGADITVLTNMMISAQFIQDSNLDHIDNGNEYTTDYATMHLSNGFNKATKDKNFYSLFFSKPFGESGQHRWNNITMFEENGGKWNRLDVEYTIDDNTVATAEYNKYWGEKNTQFGQLEKSSNLQVGLKYTF